MAVNNAVQSLGYGLLSFLFAAVIAALCSGVKAALRKILKGGGKQK